MTEYHIASNAELKECYRLARVAGIPCKKLQYPTIVAKRDDAVVGFVSRVPSTKAIICGPLVVDPAIRHPSFLALHLIDLFDSLLAASGVKSYLFNIDPSNETWSSTIKKFGLTPFAETDGRQWFKRELWTAAAA